MFTSIVVGTDGSATARQAVRVAVELARLCGAHLHIVSAFPTFDTGIAVASMAAIPIPGDSTQIEAHVRSMLEELAKEAGDAGVSASTHALPGSAARTLIDVAEGHGADLIVVGNRGMHGARRYLGSVPNTVTHHASCAVLVVPTC